MDNEKEKNESVKRIDEDLDLASFGNRSVKVTVDPERTGQVIGDFFKKLSSSVVRRLLEKQKNKKNTTEKEIKDND